MKKYKRLFESFITTYKSSFDNSEYNIYLNPSMSEISKIFKDKRHESSFDRRLKAVISFNKPNKVYIAYYRITHSDLAKAVGVKEPFHSLIFDFKNKWVLEGQMDSEDYRQMEKDIINSKYIQKVFKDFEINI